MTWEDRATSHPDDPSAQVTCGRVRGRRRGFGRPAPCISKSALKGNALKGRAGRGSIPRPARSLRGPGRRLAPAAVGSYYWFHRDNRRRLSFGAPSPSTWAPAGERATGPGQRSMSLSSGVPIMGSRVTLLINHASGKARFAGWSDTFYHSADDRGTVLTATQGLADKMDKCMGKNSRPVACRITQLSTAGNAVVAGKRLVQVERIDRGPLPATSGTPSSTPEKALLMRDWGTGGYSRTWWLNGIPDDQETDGGDFVPNGAYGAKLTALINELISEGNGWRLRVQDRTVPKRRITTFTAAGLVTTLEPHGYANGDKVHVIGFRYFSDVPQQLRINGAWTINNVTPNTFQLVLPAAGTLDDNPEGQGFVYKEQLILVQYASPGAGIAPVTIVRGGSHNVGRPFDLHTGARTS